MRLCLKTEDYSGAACYLGLWPDVISASVMSLLCKCCTFDKHKNCTTDFFQDLFTTHFCSTAEFQITCLHHISTWERNSSDGVICRSSDCVDNSGGAAEPVVFVSPTPLTSFLWSNPVFWQGAAGGAAVCVRWVGLCCKISVFFLIYLQLVDCFVAQQEGRQRGEWHSQLFVFAPTPSLASGPPSFFLSLLTDSTAVSFWLLQDHGHAPVFTFSLNCLICVGRSWRCRGNPRPHLLQVHCCICIVLSWGGGLVVGDPAALRAEVVTNSWGFGITFSGPVLFCGASLSHVHALCSNICLCLSVHEYNEYYLSTCWAVVVESN